MYSDHCQNYNCIRLIKSFRNLVNKFGNHDQVSTSVQPFRASLCTAKLKINFYQPIQEMVISLVQLLFCICIMMCIFIIINSVTVNHKCDILKRNS